MRKLLVFLIVVAVLLVVVDRVAVVGVQREIASQIEAKYNLAATPTVEIKGIPFLTQAFQGRYEEIAIGMGAVTQNGVRLERVDATLFGVSAPLMQLIQDAEKADIRAERVTGTVVISIASLSARAPRGIKVAGTNNGTVRISGNLSVLGQSVPVTADMKIDVVSAGIRLTPTKVEFANGASLANAARLVSFTYPVKNLPLNLKITKVTTTSNGLAVQGTATDVPLKG
ncbi:DUF2993 domain-containing protein [Streptosporangiaceae bacterium NEAU-GS5]|nr:DUF2993 domain-containing protein [Streptosporangiaceae bacterium NEAU-GS5]